MKNINDLTEDCLRHLFAKVPLQECIRLRLICTHWCAIIEKICLARKSLKLFGSIWQIRAYPGLLGVFHVEDCEHLKLKPLGQDDDLIIQPEYLNKGHWNLLLKLFPNTTQLVVLFDVCDLFDNLPYLLKCLSGRLEKVTMLGNIMGMSARRTRAICDAFNSLRALKSLEVYCCDFNGEKEFFGAPISPAILQRLEHLALRNYSFGLIPHLTGNRFKSLTIFGWNRINLTLFAKELNANPLTERLSQLCFDCVDQEFFRFICNHFTVLKHLDIMFKQSDMKFNLEMAKDLSRLTQLEGLRLQNVQLDINCDDSKPPQIGTVTELYILDVYGTCSKDQFDCKQFCLVFSLLFPNVTKLEVKVGSKDKVTDLKQHLPNYFKYIRKPQVYVIKRDYLGRHKDEF